MLAQRTALLACQFELGINIPLSVTDVQLNRSQGDSGEEKSESCVMSVPSHTEMWTKPEKGYVLCIKLTQQW